MRKYNVLHINIFNIHGSFFSPAFGQFYSMFERILRLLIFKTTTENVNAIKYHHHFHHQTHRMFQHQNLMHPPSP